MASGFCVLSLLDSIVTQIPPNGRPRFYNILTWKALLGSSSTAFSISQIKKPRPRGLSEITHRSVRDTVWAEPNPELMKPVLGRRVVGHVFRALQGVAGPLCPLGSALDGGEGGGHSLSSCKEP